MSNLSKILAGIVVVIILIFIISYFGKGTTTDTQSLVKQNGVAEIGEAKYVLTLLNKMSEVKLNDAIFTNQGFVLLNDNSVVLIPQSVSRDNPFAPVSASELSSVSTTTR